jgi:hypothetical protein
MFTIGKAPDFDLTSVEPSLAKNAKALIIQRVPPPELILGTQDRQSIFKRKMNVHFWRENNLLDC